MELSHVIYEETDGVATITFNRPEVYNAFNEQMLDEMAEVWDHVQASDDVRAVIITGAGEKAFCTGIDRTTIPEDWDFDPYTYEDPGKRFSPKSRNVWKPVIAAVNGIACGGAFYLLGECDILIASSNATFFDPHVTWGMTASYESIMLLSRLPLGDVLRVALMGNYERMSAARAADLGMVSQVVEPEELMETAGWIASSIAAQDASAIQSTLRLIWAARDMTTAQGVGLGNVFLNLGGNKDSLKEGQTRFLQGARVPWRLR